MPVLQEVSLKCSFISFIKVQYTFVAYLLAPLLREVNGIVLPMWLDVHASVYANSTFAGEPVYPLVYLTNITLS